MDVIETAAEFPFVSEVTRKRANPSAWEALKALKAASQSGGAWVPAGLAAEMLGVGKQRLYDLIEEGTIHGEKYHGHLFLSEDSVVAYAKRERKAGRPPKVQTIAGTIKAVLKWSGDVKEGKEKG